MYVALFISNYLFRKVLVLIFGWLFEIFHQMSENDLDLYLTFDLEVKFLIFFIHDKGGPTPKLCDKNYFHPAKFLGDTANNISSTPTIWQFWPTLKNFNSLYKIHFSAMLLPGLTTKNHDSLKLGICVVKWYIWLRVPRGVQQTSCQDPLGSPTNSIRACIDIIIKENFKN